MYLCDNLVCQVNALKRNRTCLRDFEDQACDTDEALQQHRAAREKVEKKEEELKTVLLTA